MPRINAFFKLPFVEIHYGNKNTCFLVDEPHFEEYLAALKRIIPSTFARFSANKVNNRYVIHPLTDDEDRMRDYLIRAREDVFKIELLFGTK